MFERLWSELARRDRLLAWTGALHFLLLAVALVLVPVDPRTVLGVDPWIKPIKFSASVGIYLWTLAWFMPYIEGPRWAKTMISRVASIVMLVEIFCIFLQAGRGTTSHFNFSTPLDASIFAAMGLMILVNTLLLVGLLVLLLWRPAKGLSTPYLSGLRLGVVTILFGSLIGQVMITHGGHSVGGPDGGPGLPLVNWQSEVGDYRPAHFLALHGLQIIPLFAFLLVRKTSLARRRARLVVFAFTALYLAGVTLLFGLASRGLPITALL